MNKAFTKRRKIILDDNWYLNPDKDNGVILVFHEIRQREKIEKGSGPQVKTGEIEDYEYEEKYYFTRIVQALKEYVEETQNKCKTLKEILEKQEKIESILNALDKEFRQFE
jgi:hypothetical protein